MQQNKVAGHTYQLQEERPLQYFLRGIPKEVPKTEVQAALEEEGYTVQNLEYYTSLKLQDASGLPLKLPHLIIKMGNTEENKKFIQLKALRGVRIEVSQYMPPRQPVQCKNCQRFGHSKNYCTHPPRCVRCTEDHGTGQCTLPRLGTENHCPPKCVNCGKKQPTNYNGCAVAVAEKKPIMAQRPRPLTSSQAPPAYISYAAATAGATRRPLDFTTHPQQRAAAPQVSQPPPHKNPTEYPPIHERQTIIRSSNTHNTHQHDTPTAQETQIQVERAITLLHQIPLTSLTQLLIDVTDKITKDTHTPKIRLILEVVFTHLLTHG